MNDDSRLERLRRRVEADPASIAFAALADEYRRCGEPAAAVEVCRAGLTRHPAYLSARVALGQALLDLGDLDSAEAELQRVLNVAPENLASIRALCDIHQRRQEAIAVAAVPVAAIPEPNVIPFETDPMRFETDGPSARVLSPVFGTPEGGPVLSSLDQFLDAIVTLKRAAV